MTQDFVFVNAKSFLAPDAEHFLKSQKVIEANANDPEIFKKAVSGVAAGTNAVLGLVGLHSANLEQLGAPHTHPLGETFGSTAAVRYGDYVAKITIAPDVGQPEGAQGQARRRGLPLLGAAGRDRRVLQGPSGPSGTCCVQLCTDAGQDADRGPVGRVARGR